MNNSGPWLSPAKLNLFLYINGRRSDGYHELQTLFQFIDYCDELYFDLRNDKVLQLSPAIDGLAAEDNLIIKAARLLQTYAKNNAGADIRLVKRLPMGGGIGGGSSNAATTLLVLNTLWQCGLSTEELASLGLRLGADVPIFIHGHAAFAEGVGEKIQAVEIAQPWYVVLVPQVHVSTQSVFSAENLKRDTPKRSWAELKQADWINDCQGIVRKSHPEVAKALDWLLEYAPSRMTGTGSCVFAAFENEQSARRTLVKCPPQFQGFICKACNQSPLLAQLEQATLL